MATTEPQLSFKAILPTDTLTAFLEPQLALCDEAKWHLNDEGIRVRAVDPANVALIDATLGSQAFESYTPTDGLIGLSLNKLEDYATSKAAGDLLQLSIDPETRRLTVDVGPTVYDMALIDPASIRNEPDPPNLGLPAEVGLDGALFTNALDAVDLVSDHVVLTADPDSQEFVISGEGDVDSATTTLGDEELLSADVGDTAVTSYLSLDYLTDMVKPIPSDGAVRVRLGEEMPLEIQYALADEDVTVTNTLAPRIQRD